MACTFHPHAEETTACSDCGRPFCEQCLAAILGRKLCRDCKAIAVEGVVRRPQRHPQALLALVIPIVGYATCLLIPITSLIGLAMGSRVLRELRDEPHLSGRSLALAAMVVSGGTLAAWITAVAATLLARELGR